MKLTFVKPVWRAPKPRTWLGIGLIAVSVIGTVWVVSDSRAGTGIVLATTAIPAGRVIVADDVVAARVVSNADVQPMSIRTVVGQRTAVDIAPGDIVSAHMMDSTATDRTVVSVPVGITPATAITAGSRIELWFVATGQSPATLVAEDAVVVATRRGSFGDGDIVDLSIDSREENRVLGSLGADGTFVFTVGSQQP